MTSDRYGWTLGVVAIAALLAACGDPQPAEESTVSTAARPTSEFTAAVPLGEAAAAARLQFQLVDRPMVGKASTVRFKAIPSGPVQKIQIVFEPDPALRIVDELRATAVIDGPATARAEPLDLQVMPTAEGVLLLKATVVTEAAIGASKSTEFAIPVLVPPSPEPAAPSGG
jgi:hypothetical protein